MPRARYKVGERVILRESKTYGRYSIHPKEFGKEFIVTRAACGGRSDYYYIGAKPGEARYSVYNCMLTRVKLSKFDKKVRAYIQRELGNG